MTSIDRSGLRSVAVSAVSWVLGGFTWFGPSSGAVMAQAPPVAPAITTEFRLADCAFHSQGITPHVILRPGYRLVLEGTEDGQAMRLVITVLHETKRVVVPGIGEVRTRVVEERMTADGALVEKSRNYFAICTKTNDVVYFGEAVDIFSPDGTVTHEGSWQAGVDGALPGVIMPGTFLLGSRYAQEQAPGVALDRAEHVAMGLEVDTKAGRFEGCVRVQETSPLEPGSVTLKDYCPGVGLVSDSVVELVEFGFRTIREDEDE